MADVWEIARYVEAHPDDADQRWRLAKKLYTAWEYRLALEHLQILKNEWPDRLNVRRYLAATYYRLGRYDDAIQELREAVEKWPDEIGVREQLARSLLAARNREGALEVWETVLKLHPEHRFAAKAVKSIRKEIQKEGAAARGDVVGPAAFTQADERPCPYCGAMNGVEFERCWQCHGVLKAPAAVKHAPRPRRAERPDPWPILAGLTLLALVPFGLYRTLRAFYPATFGDEELPQLTTIADIVSGELMTVRLIALLVLLVAWPIALRLAAALIAFEDLDTVRVTVAGVVFAVLAYALTWLPPASLWLGPIVLAVATLPVCLWAFEAGYGRGALIWLIQGSIAGLAGLTVLAGVHGFAILPELPVIARHLAEGRAISESRYKGTSPIRATIQWEGTGSSWLDARTSHVEFRIETGPVARRLFFELSDPKRTYVYKEILGQRLAAGYGPVEPGHPYSLLVEGENGVDVTLTVRSFLSSTVEGLSE